MPTVNPASATQRLAWPDVAKGISIIGVVLLHVSLAVPQGMDSLAAEINHLLDPLRMPLFFMVSGFFSVKIMKYNFRELFAKRLWFFLVPYGIWVPVELWFKFREYNMFHGTPMPEAVVYLQHLVEARNMAWFLYALALFSFILWLSRKLPHWAGIAVAFAPLLFLPLNSEWHMIGKSVMYLPVFILGARLHSYIREFAHTALDPRRIVFGASLYVLGFGVSTLALVLGASFVDNLMLPLGGSFGPQEMQMIINMVVHLLMLPAAIIGAVLLAKVPVLSPALQTLGRNTLPIYLGHPIALTVLYHYNIRAADWQIELGAPELWSRTSTWMVVAVVISALGGGVFWLLMKVPGVTWTLTPPRIDHLLLGGGYSSATAKTYQATKSGREVLAGARQDSEISGTGSQR
ncbi:acyltransferase family protein [Corynebacterium sp. A21]|uniref:acyltransferase family protein n=1 Tax=Corynebacterium sp. A21 TaxID=3457318 RepID=UPI003FD13DB6